MNVIKEEEVFCSIILFLMNFFLPDSFFFTNFGALLLSLLMISFFHFMRLKYIVT